MRKALGRPWVGVRVCHLLLLFVKTPFSSKGQKLFEPYLKKYTWLVYNRDDNFCILKSVEQLTNQKLTNLARSHRAEIVKMLHSVDILVFENSKWPTCVYMIKNITQTVVTYF